MQVTNNVAKAETLTQQADDLEESVAKEFAEKSSNFVMFQQSDMLDSSREDMGIITVSQSMGSLGMIESANSVALTLFGYNKRDMLKKNVNIIVPQPMSAMHDKFLQAFVETGRSVRAAHVPRHGQAVVDSNVGDGYCRVVEQSAVCFGIVLTLVRVDDDWRCRA